MESIIQTRQGHTNVDLENPCSDKNEFGINIYQIWLLYLR